MPLIPVMLAMPPDLAEVRAADVDGDQIDELVLVSKVPNGVGPDLVRLTILDLDAHGEEIGRRRVDLEDVPALWDMHAGIWVIDGRGPAQAGRGGSRLGEDRTPLADLGPTTPMAADFAHDIDRDGVPDLIWWSGGYLRVRSAEGREWGRVAAPARGQLTEQRRSGAPSFGAASLSPPVVVADVDGDGLDDLFLPWGRRAKVYFTGESLGERSLELRLPLDLDPRDEPGKDVGPRRELSDAWFRDFDGDGKLDLLTHHWAIDGGWFGATAELSFYAGTGAGFAAPVTMETSRAAVDVRILDYDSDGDLDLLVPQVDTGFANLGRALVSQEVRIEVELYEMRDGRFVALPLPLRTLEFPLDDEDPLHAEFEADLNGDGLIDLVTNDRKQKVVVYAGTPKSVSEEPLVSIDLDLPPGDKPFFVHDLTGDGRAEILVWGPGERRARLLIVDTPDADIEL